MSQSGGGRAPQWPSAMPDRSLRLLVAAVLLVWVAAALPLASGVRTVYLRDVFDVHVPLFAWGAESLAAGEIPAFEPARGLGQPYRGNPQALPFYPGRLAFLVLPFWSAVGLHYVGHWLLAALGIAWLVRRLGGDGRQALLAALTYGGSGWMLTALGFAHAVVVAAWWPWALAAVVASGGRAVAGGGLAVGLALLGGEPILAALGALLLLALAALVHGRWRGPLRAALILGAGGLVAAPQLVATWRILPESARAAGALSAGDHALAPGRLLELLLPLPWGEPAALGDHGWSAPFTSEFPLIYSLYLGIATLPLVLGALRRERGPGTQSERSADPAGAPDGAGPRADVPRAAAPLAGAEPASPPSRPPVAASSSSPPAVGPTSQRPLAVLLAAFAVAGYLLAWLGGVWPELAALASWFRYPEKLLFWPALTLPLVAAFGLGRVTPGRWPVGTRVPAALLLAAALALVAVRGPAVQVARSADAPAGETTSTAAAERFLVRSAALARQLALAGVLLGAVGWALRAGRRDLALVVQAVSLCQLAPLFATDSTAPYRLEPALAADLPVGTAVLPGRGSFPPWGTAAELAAAPSADRRGLARADAALLAPVTGARRGLHYPLAPDADGLASLRTRFLHASLAESSWAVRREWLVRLGVEEVILAEPLPPELPAAGAEAGAPAAAVAGLLAHRVTVRADPALAFWPRRLVTVRNPAEVVAAVSRLASAAEWPGGSPVNVAASRPGGGRTGRRTGEERFDEVVVVERPLVQRSARVEVLGSGADRLRLRVEGEGGVVVVRRTFSRLWEARTSDGAALATLPVDLVLLGVEVPRGRHEIELAVDARPESIAGGLAGLVALLLLVVLGGGRSSRIVVESPR